jgi:endonuclease YncB( thermonuclease family)/tRNA A-37 threonylcarbamoyl transferase component Bud32
VAKISDKDLQRFIDDINQSSGGVKTPEPAFQRYKKQFLRELDFDVLQKFSPEQLIDSARTQEELFILGEHLEEKWGRDHYWWKKYHEKRIELGHSPSFYGMVDDSVSGKRRGLWGVPVSAQEYIRNEHLAGPQAVAVNRSLVPATWEQVSGNKVLFNKVNTPDGIVLRKWTGLKPPVLKSNTSRNALIFDIETTGLIGKDNSNIISVGLLNTQTGKSSGIYADFNQSIKYSAAIENKIIPQWKSAVQASRITPVTERELVEETISSFSKAVSSGQALMGYNIKEFDIPKIYETAKKYGLHKQFEKIVKQAEIVDVAEHAVPFLSKHLGNKFVGWQESELGLKPLGWQLGIVAESLGYNVKNAHEAKADVAMTRFVWDALQNEEKASAIFKESVASGKYEQLIKAHTGKELVPVAKASKWASFTKPLLASEADYARPFTEHLAKIYPNVTKVAEPEVANAVKSFMGKKLPFINKHIKGATVGKALRYTGYFALSNLLWPGDFWRAATDTAAFDLASYAARGKGNWKYVAGIAALGAANTLYSALESKDSLDLSGFSGKFNSIPPEVIEQNKEGLPNSLMGVTISPDILSFREKILDNPEEKQALEDRIKAAQAKAQENIDTFRSSDLKQTDLSSIEGLNQKNQNLREVDLSNFKLEVEDADTIFLHRKGINLDNPIQIRLSGIDAPEVASHELDPLEEVRIFQNQPGGEEATKALEAILANQKNIRLIVDAKNKTYGRSLGVLIGDEDRNIAYDLLSIGAVSALPFGPSSEDVVSRTPAQQIETRARQEEAGMWSLARYKAIHRATEAIGNPLTYNTLTEKTKLGENLNLGAYASFLEGLGTENRQLTLEETVLSSRLGKILKNQYSAAAYQHRFSGKDDNYNTIEGLHPQSNGPGAQKVQENTEFGSGWDPIRAMARTIYKGLDEQAAFDKLRRSSKWMSALEGAKEIKQLSYGSYGTTFLMEGKIGKQSFNFIKKIPETPLYNDFIPNLPNKSKRLAALKEEASIMPLVENRIAPSLYGFKGESLYMELMPGKTVHELIQEGTPIPKKQIEDTIRNEISKISKSGIVNTDIHTGNIMFDQSTQNVSWIDWGMGKTISSGTDYQKMITNMESKLITPIQQSSAKISQKESIISENWGEVMPKTPIRVKSRMSTSNRKQALKRMKRFNKLSTDAVGIGLKSAHNAGRKHTTFSTLG